MFGHPGGQVHAKSAPLLFPHVPEWGGLGAALFSPPLFSRSSTLKSRQKGAPCVAESRGRRHTASFSRRRPPKGDLCDT
eukprot:scaffold65099_cov67-Phaeocystis_antarctica.AAC.1